jgi:hypothetical protein
VYKGVNCTTREVVAIKKMKFMKKVVKNKKFRIRSWLRKKSS